MYIYKKTGIKLLTRCEDPAEIPAMDRAIALASCQLLIGLDRSFVEDIFFSRAVAACNGAWVWSEQVLQAMAHAIPMPGHDSASPATPKKQKSPTLDRIRLYGRSEQGALSSALVTPERVLETNSSTFSNIACSAQFRLQIAKDTIEWLSKVPDPALELQCIQSARYLGASLSLPVAQTRVLELMALALVNEPFKCALAGIALSNMSTAVNIIARWVGADRLAIHTLFSSYGPLAQAGVHEGMLRQISDMESALRLDNFALATQLQETHVSQEAFLNSFLNLAAPAQIKTDAVPHLSEFHQLATSLFALAAAAGQQGVNVMLYGAPGSGKTEYAKLLAQESKLALYEVPCATNMGNSLEPHQRLASFLMMLNALKGRTDAALLFDESEEVFDLPIDRGQKANKAWMNQLIERTPVPVIWTGNSIEDVDPAHLRRFSLLKEFKTAPRAVKENYTRKYLDALQLPEHMLQTIIDMPDLTPGHIQNAARTVTLASPNNDVQACLWISEQLNTSRKALGLSSLQATATQRTAYSSEFLNISHGPSPERLIDYLKRSPKLSLCLYGTPGTGKTGFAKHIAEALGRDIIIKTAGSLLSKYIGDTEQRIGTMFDEASAAGPETLLLLDEADTLLRDRDSASYSWEISHTNEFLARMEAFPGTFICTTNLMSELDPAILRRFQFKLRFNVLTTEQASAMYQRIFSEAAPATLHNVGGLVPADFVNVQRQKLVYGDELDSSEYVALLEAEVTSRRGGDYYYKPIGFTTRLET